MAMDITKNASKASDERLRAALEAGETDTVQLAPQINKMRSQVCRAGLGKGGNGQD